MFLEDANTAYEYVSYGSVPFDNNRAKTCKYHNTALILPKTITNLLKYYKPWQLSPRNEATIKTQVEEVEALIEEEKSEWASRHQEQGLKAEEKEESEVKVKSDVLMGEPHTESSSISNIDTTNPSFVLAAQSSQVKTEKDNLEEHNGEVVVEAEEDTVIY